MSLSVDFWRCHTCNNILEIRICFGNCGSVMWDNNLENSTFIYSLIYRHRIQGTCLSLSIYLYMCLYPSVYIHIHTHTHTHTHIYIYIYIYIYIIRYLYYIYIYIYIFPISIPFHFSHFREQNASPPSRPPQSLNSDTSRTRLLMWLCFCFEIHVKAYSCISNA